MKIRVTMGNWFAIAAVLFVLAMYAALIAGGVPDFYALPFGLTAITSAVLALRDPR